MTTKKPGGFPVFLLLLALGTGGCSSLEQTHNHPATAIPLEAAVPPETVVSPEAALLRCASRIRGMNANELNNKADALQKAWANQRNEDNRMRLALFLALAPPPLGDRLRALTLLDVPPSEQAGRGRNHPLAQVLLPILQDYRRLDEALASQQAKMRELHQSNEQMRQKLDALREIDTQIQERPKTK